MLSLNLASKFINHAFHPKGHDTTAMALSWTIFLLGHHPDIQRRCQDELDKIFGSDHRQPDMDDLRSMKYLECCIKEALRLFPSVPIVGREVHTTFKLSECPNSVSDLRTSDQ